MAIYNKATRTAKGRAYDASVNNGEFSAQYAFMYLSDYDYTAMDVDVLTELEGVVIQAGVSEVKKNSDVSVSIYAPYTNAGRVTPFELRTIGLMAMHPADGLVLHSIVTASVPDTVPEDDGANLVDETFQFTLEEVNADNTLLQGNSNGLVTVDIFNKYKNETTIILGGKVDVQLTPTATYPLSYNSALVSPGYRYDYSKTTLNQVGITFALRQISGVTIRQGDIIATLPEGFRPSKQIVVPIVIRKNNQHYGVPMDIATNGTIFVQPPILGENVFEPNDGGEFFMNTLFNV